MAEFPPNLDDGELWLPADIFPEVQFSRPHHPSDLAYVEDLAQRFAALALLQRHPNLTLAKTPPNLQRFTSPVPYGSFPAGYRFGVGQGLGLHGLRTGYGPVYPYQIAKPVQSQVESFVGARARAMQIQQNRILQNRVRPGVGGDGGGGGLVREYGGTGVFLPRIGGATGSTSRSRIGSDGRRRQSARHRKEIQVIPHRNPIKMVDVGMGKQEGCHYQLPPDVGLPQDWTY